VATPVADLAALGGGVIRVECTCGELFNADEAHIGKHVRCRRCGRTVAIARVEPGPVPAVGAAPRSPRPAAPAPAPAPASPHRDRRSPASNTLGYVLGAAVVLFAIAGVRLWLKTPEAPPPSTPPAAFAPLAEVPSAPPTPAPPCDARPRPWSGAVLGRADQSGEGDLTVSNGTGYDAVVTLADAKTGRPRYAMFVGNATAATLHGVRVGSYRLRFRLGERLNRRGWFCEPAGAQEFDRKVAFKISYDEDQSSADSFTVTLHHVEGGNATTHPIPDSLVALPGG
jgi:hypothetical protein